MLLDHGNTVVLSEKWFMQESKNANMQEKNHKNCVPMQFMQKITILITTYMRLILAILQKKSQLITVSPKKLWLTTFFEHFLHKNATFNDLFLHVLSFCDILAILHMPVYVNSAKNAICKIRASAILCDIFRESINCISRDFLHVEKYSKNSRKSRIAIIVIIIAHA